MLFKKLKELKSFEAELSKLLNCHSVDTLLGMNDFIIAAMITKFIKAITLAKKEREKLKNGNTKKQNLPNGRKTRGKKDRITPEG